jgi:hypothetical protein
MIHAKYEFHVGCNLYFLSCGGLYLCFVNYKWVITKYFLVAKWVATELFLFSNKKIILSYWFCVMIHTGYELIGLQLRIFSCMWVISEFFIVTSG